MTTLRVVERLEHDLQHLIWRVGIYDMSACDIRDRYLSIQKKHTNIAQRTVHPAIQGKLAEWHPTIHQLIESKAWGYGG